MTASEHAATETVELLLCLPWSNNLGLPGMLGCSGVMLRARSDTETALVFLGSVCHGIAFTN